MSLEENQLIVQAQAGDVNSFTSLAERFERRIFMLALHYTRDPHDAEDLSQEVWLKAFQGLNSFRRDSSFYTWLRQIMVNTFLNHRRAEVARKEKVSSTSFEDGSSDISDAVGFTLNGRAPDIEESYQRKIMTENVMKALEELTAQQRLIFLLKHREGMTYEEIAKAFGCSTGAVKKALFRAVMKLRQQFGIEAAPPELAQSGAARHSLGESHARLP